MTIEKLKRVMWRLQEIGTKNIKRSDVQKAIMIECGTSRQTYYNNIEALCKLGWLQRRKWKFRITGLHETEDYE